MNSEIIIVPSLFFMVGHRLRDRGRIRRAADECCEFHSKLLDRLRSAKEFGEFFTTAGTRFLQSLSSRKAARHSYGFSDRCRPDWCFCPSALAFSFW